MEENRRYTKADLMSPDGRNKVTKELEEKTWLLKVRNFPRGKKYGFLKHPSFEGDIIFYDKTPDSAVAPERGQIIEATVELSFNNSKGVWGFAARRLKKEAASDLVPVKEKMDSTDAMTAVIGNDAPKSAEERPLLEDTKLPLTVIKRVAKKKPPLLDDARARLQKRKISAVSDFGRDADLISIYIDESWPGSVSQDGSRADEGVIAGIAWLGYPDPDKLPFINTHLSRTTLTIKTAYEALDKLFDLPQRCFPFILPISIPGENAHTYYDALVQQAIKLLLGWLIPPNRHKRVRIRIYLEQIEGHAIDDDMTAYYQGVLSEQSGRFSHCRIECVQWKEKDFEYIPYGDLLAYLPQEHGPKCLEMGKVVNYRSLPGYVPLSIELVPRLERLEHIETTQNMDDLLDFFLQAGNTALGKFVLNDMKKRFDEKQMLKGLLIRSMEMRYREKERNLPVLRGLFGMVRKIVREIPNDARITLKLMMFVMNLQDANHDGDPERVVEETFRYQSIRDRALLNDAELVAHIDLNLSVHYSDRFEFGKAAEVINRLNADADRFALHTRGIIKSSLGQLHAIYREFDDAEPCFKEALALFDEADLPTMVRDAEKDQTSVYRAICAMDGQRSDTVTLMEAVIGPVVDAAKRLATDTSAASLYHHHLLLRCLYTFPNLKEASDAYLEQRIAWSIGWAQHPWQLIHFYRAMLLIRENNADTKRDAIKWFAEALAVSNAAEHGDTIRLIGAVIAACAYCFGKEESFKDMAKTNLDKLKIRIPAACPTIDLINAHLEAPHMGQISELLAALPFNYH